MDEMFTLRALIAEISFHWLTRSPRADAQRFSVAIGLQASSANLGTIGLVSARPAVN